MKIRSFPPFLGVSRHGVKTPIISTRKWGAVSSTFILIKRM